MCGEKKLDKNNRGCLEWRVHSQPARAGDYVSRDFRCLTSFTISLLLTASLIRRGGRRGESGAWVADERKADFTTQDLDESRPRPSLQKMSRPVLLVSINCQS